MRGVRSSSSIILTAAAIRNPSSPGWSGFHVSLGRKNGYE
jgi:hypothetical protein